MSPSLTPPDDGASWRTRLSLLGERGKTPVHQETDQSAAATAGLCAGRDVTSLRVVVFPQIASTLPAFINTFFVSFFIRYFLCIRYHSLNVQIRLTNTAKISDLHNNFV